MDSVTVGHIHSLSSYSSRYTKMLSISGRPASTLANGWTPQELTSTWLVGLSSNLVLDGTERQQIDEHSKSHFDGLCV